MTGPEPRQGKRDDLELLDARTLRRTLAFWPIVVLCALAAAAAGFVSASREPEVYSASAGVKIADLDLASALTSQSVQISGQDVETRAGTLAKLAVAGPVLASASRALGGEPTAAQLAGKVSASAERKTTIVQITAKAGDAREAARIADAVRNAFLAQRLAQTNTLLAAAERDLRAQLTAWGPTAQTSRETRSLRRRLQLVGSLRAVSTGGVEAAQPAKVPTSAVSPRPARTALLGLVVGGIFGAGLALLLALVDRRVRDEDDLATLAGAAVLATLPDLATGGPTRAPVPNAALEAIALVRARLPQLGGPVRLLVTSPRGADGGGEGATAWALAVASSLAGARVLYVEADLRAASAYMALNLPAAPGLAEVLEGTARLDSAIQPVDVEGDGRRTRIDVLLGGVPASGPAALLERAATDAFASALSDGYDLAVLYVPAALGVADVSFLARHVDGIVPAIRLGAVSRRDVQRLAGLLSELEAPVLGIVACDGHAGAARRHARKQARRGPASSHRVAADSSRV